jgi:hypothetical protein
MFPMESVSPGKPLQTSARGSRFNAEGQPKRRHRGTSTGTRRSRAVLLLAADAARADDVSWASHIEEFRGIRSATVSFFRNLPAEAWARSGIASGSPFTVRALAAIAAGHVLHHTAIVKERYV